MTKFEVGKKYRFRHSPDDDFYIEILYVGKEQVFYVDREGGEGCTYLVGSDNYVEYIEPKKIVKYFNVYCDNQVGLSNDSRKEADQYIQRDLDRIACVRVEFTEGQFDD